jgi:hypothetical protein
MIFDATRNYIPSEFASTERVRNVHSPVNLQIDLTNVIIIGLLLAEKK